MSRCKTEVPQRGMAFARWAQCSRKSWKDGYCKQHHPDTVEARNIKLRKQYEEKQKNQPYYRLRNLIDQRRKELNELYQIASVETYFTPIHLTERLEKIQKRINEMKGQTNA